jgi:hypothetical protein
MTVSTPIKKRPQNVQSIKIVQASKFNFSFLLKLMLISTGFYFLLSHLDKIKVISSSSSLTNQNTPFN